MGANAQTSVPTFVAGEILTAANMNISARTGIPVFATSTTRDAAFGGTGEKTLAEGQFAYLEDSNTTQYYDGAAWQTLVNVTPRIGQVVSTNKSDTFSTTSTTFTDITSFSVSITPTLATSKVLVIANYNVGMSGEIVCFTRLMRDSTAISIGDASGSRARVTNAVMAVDAGTYTANNFSSQSVVFLDSPATTSATIYKIQMLVNAGTGFLNRTGGDADNAQRPRGASNITVMEVIV